MERKQKFNKMPKENFFMSTNQENQSQFLTKIEKILLLKKSLLKFLKIKTEKNKFFKPMIQVNPFMWTRKLARKCIPLLLYQRSRWMNKEILLFWMPMEKREQLKQIVKDSHIMWMQMAKMSHYAKNLLKDFK